MAMIFDELGEYEKAEDGFREVIKGYEMVFGKEHRHTLVGQHDRSPLSWAAGNGYDTAMGLLLAKDGINPDLKDSVFGLAPLSWAAGKGHKAVVQLLLATGKVDVNSKDKHGRTPLSFAVAGGHELVVQLLLATGKADVNLRDEDGRTPFGLAEDDHIVELLSPFV